MYRAALLAFAQAFVPVELFEERREIFDDAF
jgi:hypothetical protein